jgi:oligoribonuclease
MSETVLAVSDQNLVWIDLEMTGLFPDRDRIIEIAVVVTDPQLTVRVEGPCSRCTRATRRSTRWTPGTRARTAAAA